MLILNCDLDVWREREKERQRAAAREQEMRRESERELEIERERQRKDLQQREQRRKPRHNVKNKRIMTKARSYNLQAQSDKLAQEKKLDETKTHLYVPKSIDARTSVRLPKIRWTTEHERQHSLYAENSLV